MIQEDTFVFKFKKHGFESFGNVKKFKMKRFGEGDFVLKKSKFTPHLKISYGLELKYFSLQKFSLNFF